MSKAKKLFNMLCSKSFWRDFFRPELNLTVEFMNGTHYDKKQFKKIPVYRYFLGRYIFMLALLSFLSFYAAILVIEETKLGGYVLFEQNKPCLAFIFSLSFLICLQVLKDSRIFAIFMFGIAFSIAFLYSNEKMGNNEETSVMIGFIGCALFLLILLALRCVEYTANFVTKLVFRPRIIIDSEGEAEASW